MLEIKAMCENTGEAIKNLEAVKTILQSAKDSELILDVKIKSK